MSGWAVNGAARGGGMTLAISCDVMLAAESANFGYPEIELGLVSAIHFALLPRVVGRHGAFELLLTGRRFEAAEAASMGLISRVMPDACCPVADCHICFQAAQCDALGPRRFHACQRSRLPP
ncbi:enoyl-CoA hydratase/isomerase family protein [Roseomonas harenae]|nr:enoyl-CoA hydratase/isomerase family protein [Roseomonas harenae]